jgi:hypothetical protein
MRVTRFKQKVRIDPKQLEWIRENKGSYTTLAGKLDEIINFYRREVYIDEQARV